MQQQIQFFIWLIRKCVTSSLKIKTSCFRTIEGVTVSI